MLKEAGMVVAHLIAKGHKLSLIIGVPLWGRALFKHRVAAGVEHRRVLRNIGAIRTVVDIGANRGQFALVARHCFPQAKIFSFEPQPRPAETFRQVFSKDAAVHLHAVAIGEHKGSAAIHVSARDDSSSLLPIAEAQNRLFPGTAETATETIQIGRLADYVSAGEITSPALLKLDVQGFELAALRGCENLIGYFAYIYAECSFVELYGGQALVGEIVAWLRERGFRLDGVYNVAYDRAGRAVQADFLFNRADSSNE